MDASPFFVPHSPELETPLDDFGEDSVPPVPNIGTDEASDRQLLRESQKDHSIPDRRGPTRVSLPPKPLTPLTTSSTRRSLQGKLQCSRRSMILTIGLDDLHANPLLQPSSSPPNPVTSPTVLVLQNRQRDRANSSFQNKISNSRAKQFESQDARIAPDVLIGANQNARQRVSHTKPPSRSPPIIQGIQLVPATALPDQLRSVFKFEIFNAVQSKCFATAFKSDDNIVVSAPTGSGKTIIMELAICRLVAESKGQDFKVVYQAPTKSLCAERYNDWQKKFGVLNLECAELTGDTDSNQLRDVQKPALSLRHPRNGTVSRENGKITPS